MKKFFSLIATSITFLFVTSNVYAQAPGTPFTLCPEGSFIDPICDINADTFGNVVRTIIILLFVVAIVISLIFLIWGGIKWILSGGDKSGVESARNHIIAAIVGLVIALVSFFILTVVGRIFKIDILNLQIPSIL